MPTPLPIGQRLIAAKKLYDTLDPSTMTPDEAALHAQLGKTLAAQPAIINSSRRARPPSSPTTSTDGPVQRFFHGAGIPTSVADIQAMEQHFDPVNALQRGDYSALAGPLGTMAKDLVVQTGSELGDQAGQAADAFQQGDYGKWMRHSLGAAVPFVGPPAANGDVAGAAGRAASLVAPKVLSKIGAGGGRIGGAVLGRLPERMVGSVTGSESRPAARAIMAREIGTHSDAPGAAGNLPIENFHKNVTDAWNAAGQDVSRVIAADTAVNPDKTINVQPLIEAPYSARTQQVGKYARGETTILSQLQRLTEQSEARQAAAAEHVGLKPGVNWFPGDPIEMSPQQMHEFTKDWRKSVAGGFERMDPTEQAVIGNMHDAIKTTVPGAASAMDDYHNMSLNKEALDAKVPRIQASALVPSLIETARGAATRKVVGGAAWKLPVAYGLNKAAPEPYRYTGTFRPPMAPAASASTLQAATAAPQVSVRPPATAATAAAPSAVRPPAPASPTVEANRAFTAESARLAAERERQYPVRPPGGAQSTQSNVQETLRVPSKSEPAVTAAIPVAAPQAKAMKARAPKPVAETAPPPTVQAKAAPAPAPATPKALPPKPLPQLDNPLADRPSRSTPIPRKMTAAELAERHSGTSTYVNRPTLPASKNAPKPPTTAGAKVGTSIPTPRGSGTVTHSIPKADGSTLHVVEGVKTESGKTVVVEPPTATTTAATATVASNPHVVGDTVVGTDPVGTQHQGVVTAVGTAKSGPYVTIDTKMHGTRTFPAGKVVKASK